MSDSPSPSDDVARRRLAAVNLGFFTSSASSFHPKPYNPSASSSSPIPNPPAPRVGNLVHPLPPMDPSSSDPTAVFIHPPFTSFPDAHRYPGGLTYALMASNPEWFLDPNDFVSSTASNPNAITYPTQLEPPRGWCPAKKKDLKDRGSGNWPEGEEPRLRCTFCRRTYAGVNAKSMWRRHVFEKHKIAMANRRDTVDRTRKSAPSKSAQGKENLTSSRGNRKEGSSAPPSQSMSKSKLRSLRPAAEMTANAADYYERAASYDDLMDDDAPPTPSAPRIPQEEFPALAHPDLPLSRASSQASASPPPDSPEAESDAYESQMLIRPSPVDDEVDDDPPTPSRPTIPSSPYDPRATPSFRHSPARLPSDQPWRFPSPNHPLHSQAADISLSQVTAAHSPTIISSAAMDVASSPFGLGASRSGQDSVFNTPTPRLGLGDSAKPTPRRLFGMPASLTERLKKSYRPAEESPLRHSSFTPQFNRLIASFDTGVDPFMFDSPSADLRNGRAIASPPSTSPESDSPVMRTSKLMDPVLGSGGARRSGLLEPFTLTLKRGLEEDEDEDDNEGDDDDMSGYKYSDRRIHLASPVSRCRLTQSKSYSDLILKNSPSTSRESSSGTESQPVRKRRRTLAD